MKTVVGLLMSFALMSVALSAKEQKPSLQFQPPQVISTVEPSYPVNAVAGGTVVLNVTVGSTGKIEDVLVLQHAKGFTQHALEAVKKWRFRPATLDGTPVTASVPVAFSFSQPIVWWNH